MDTEADRIRRINVVLKISERCNLVCDYCYFFFSDDDSWKKHPPFIKTGVLEGLCDFLDEAAGSYGVDRVNLVFHGGEPLLMKKANFVSMCEQLRRREGLYQFEFGLQTNGVLIDDEWIDIFNRFKVSIGVSLDGPPDVNDLHRLDKKGRSSYDRTVAGLRTLQANAAATGSTRPGLLSVINPEADGAEVYRHFAHDLGVTNMSFLTPDYTWDSELDPTVIPGVEAFMTSALRAWLADKNPKIRIRFFSELLAALVDPQAMSEVQAYRDDYRNIISVSSNGDLGPEDTIRVLDDRFHGMGLNVGTSQLSDLIESDVWQEQADAASQRPDECRECDWWRLCKAGRPINRFSKDRGFDNPSIYCNGLKEVYSELAAFVVRNGTPLSEVVQRVRG